MSLDLRYILSGISAIPYKMVTTTAWIPAILYVIVGILLSCANFACGDDAVSRYVAIMNSRAEYLEDEGGGEVRFRKLRTPETLWDVAFTSKGIVISRGKGKRVLCINPKTKNLDVCDSPGANVVWKLTSVGPEIRPGGSFRRALSMKLADDELKLSSNGLMNGLESIRFIAPGEASHLYVVRLYTVPSHSRLVKHVRTSTSQAIDRSRRSCPIDCSRAN